MSRCLVCNRDLSRITEEHLCEDCMYTPDTVRDNPRVSLDFNTETSREYQPDVYDAVYLTDTGEEYE